MENKNQNKQVIDLSDFFMTHSQANDFLLKITSIINGMYATNFNLEKAITSQFGIQKSDMFLKLLRENNLQTATLRQVQDFLKELQQTVTNLSIVSLTLAFEPSDEVLKNLSQWFIFNLKKQVLFDISVDPQLIAGVTITYNGKFKDYSVKQVFQQLVSKMIHPKAENNVLQNGSLHAQKPIHQRAEEISLGR